MESEFIVEQYKDMVTVITKHKDACAIIFHNKHVNDIVKKGDELVTIETSDAWWTFKSPVQGVITNINNKKNWYAKVISEDIVYLTKKWLIQIKICDKSKL